MTKSSGAAAVNAQQRGFTLVELMVVIAIIAIIAAIAYPSFTGNVLKSRRSEAKSALTSLASAQEQYFLTYKSYTSSRLGVGDASALTESGYYQLAVSLAANKRSYDLTATPQGAQTADTKCANFILRSSGEKTTSTSDPDCW